MQNAQDYSCKTSIRDQSSLYPNFAAEIEAIEASGEITTEIVKKIIEKHLPNSLFNRGLYLRYQGIETPIHRRNPRFEDEVNVINNKINNDFFGDIINSFTGYFAGKPIGYSYSRTHESEQEGGKVCVDEASKALTDFVVRNNMMGQDMDTAKYAAVCGYAARLFYHDEEGFERMTCVPPYEAAILSKTDISEPFAAVRYYEVQGLDGEQMWHAEYYDESKIVFFKGKTLDGLELVLEGEKQHLYDFCPLQGIPKNGEIMGDAEKVMLSIDAYDRALSDAANDAEAFASAYMIFDNVKMSESEIEKGQKNGAFQYFNGSDNPGKIYFLTKEINDGFIEHYLNRLEKNIYQFSSTPNLSDKSFAQSASGVSLKFKLLGMETKCGIFQAKMTAAGTYMFKLLASSWAKRQIKADPLQCSMEFHRNFPLDLTNEAQAVQALVSAGLPERVAYSTLSFVDDVDWVMQLKEAEKDSIPDLPPNGFEQEPEEQEAE